MGRLSEDDHELMDRFLGRIFDDIRCEALQRDAFVELVALVVTAVDLGRREEAVRLFMVRQGSALRIVK